MNKLYMPALALAFVAGSATAQSGQRTAPVYGAHVKTHPANEFVTMPARPVMNLGANRGPAWYTEDFSGGGIPTGWTNTDVQTPIGETPVTFVWSNDPTAVGPFALGYAPSSVFMSASAANGYLWANSDRGLPSAPPTPHKTRLTTTAIDCSGQPSVLLTFQSLIGVFDFDADTAVKVRVSTDLLNWTSFAPFPCLQTGAAAPPCTRWSANPQMVGVNITSVAANQPVVYLQFEWVGNWEYFWAIDDIAMTLLPDYEISLSNSYNSTTGTGEEYGRTPLSQLPATMNMGAEISNTGGMDQTNVVVDMVVTGGTGGFNASTALGTVAAGESVVSSEDVSLAGVGLGLYVANFSVTSDNIGDDENPNNNSGIRDFEVTDDIYSLDGIGNHGTVPQVLGQLGTASFADNTEDVKVMTYYEILNSLTVTGLQIVLGPNSDPGGEIIVSILDTVDVYATPSVVNQALAISDAYSLTAADIAAGTITIPFNAPITLAPNAYYAVASLFQVNDQDAYVRDDQTVGQPNVASAIWIPFDPTNNQNFYSNGTAFAIRLTSNPSIGVRENKELEGVTMFPNPTKGLVQINTTKFEKYTVEVISVLGEQVMTTSFSGSTTLDLSPFAAGVYNVRISNGTQTTVQRVTLN